MLYVIDSLVALERLRGEGITIPVGHSVRGLQIYTARVYPEQQRVHCRALVEAHSRTTAWHRLEEILADHLPIDSRLADPGEMPAAAYAARHWAPTPEDGRWLAQLKISAL